MSLSFVSTFTSSKMKDLCQKMGGKTSFSRCLRAVKNRDCWKKSQCLEIIDVGCNLKQFDGLTWFIPSPHILRQVCATASMTIQYQTTENHYIEYFANNVHCHSNSASQSLRNATGFAFRKAILMLSKYLLVILAYNVRMFHFHIFNTDEKLQFQFGVRFWPRVMQTTKQSLMCKGYFLLSLSLYSTNHTIRCMFAQWLGLVAADNRSRANHRYKFGAIGQSLTGLCVLLVCC